MEMLYKVYQNWRPVILNADYWEPNKGSQLAEKYKYLIIPSIILYIPAVFIGRRYMRNRAAFSLRSIVLAWNFFLSFLSFLGAFIMLDDWRILLFAFYREDDYLPYTRCVVTLFTLTKAVEFGDTVFLILKKKPLAFLHVYHHFTVALYCWHAQAVNVCFAHHFVFINLCIHGFMYLYYAMSTVYTRHPVLIKCRPFVTISQTLQMLIGMYLSYNALSSDTLLYAHKVNARFALAMYTSYAWLFGKFYIENYMKNVRPSMTLFVGMLHILAVAGAYMLLNSGRCMRLLFELITMYTLTTVLLSLFGDYFSSVQFSSISNIINFDNKMVLHDNDESNEEEVVDETNVEENKEKMFDENKTIELQKDVRKEKENIRSRKHNYTLMDMSKECNGKHSERTLWFSLTRMLLMILNCLATRACEYQVFWRELELLDVNHKHDNTPNNNKDEEISSSLKMRNSNNKSNEKKEGVKRKDKKKKKISLVGSLLRKVENIKDVTSKNSLKKEAVNNNNNICKNNNDNNKKEEILLKKEDGNNKEMIENESIKKNINNEIMKNIGSAVLSNMQDSNNDNKNVKKVCSSPPTQRFDLWFALMSFSIPAVYTLSVYGDILTGLCVHGALRWILELHTTPTFMQKIRIPRFK